MLTELAVAFIDTRAASLSWWLGPGPPPLARVQLASPDGGLELQMLGASHRVVATVAGEQVAEVVACAASGAPLPRRHEALHGGARYRICSTTTTYEPAGLARVARDLRRRWATEPRALVGAFPGSPHALTALVARPVADGWSWRSWHVYPGSGEVVRTRSSLVVP